MSKVAVNRTPSPAEKLKQVIHKLADTVVVVGLGLTVAWTVILGIIVKIISAAI